MSIKKFIEYFKINFVDSQQANYKKGGLNALNAIVMGIFKEVSMSKGKMNLIEKFAVDLT